MSHSSPSKQRRILRRRLEWIHGKYETALEALKRNRDAEIATAHKKYKDSLLKKVTLE